jgi:mono/diheme cytochrome c family protein
MNFRRAFPLCLVVAVFITACAHKHTVTAPAPAAVKPAAAPAAPAAAVVATAPVYVPDTTHAGDPLPEGVIGWDAISKAVDAAADQDFARFTFNFTNLTQGNLTILAVKPGCGCTTAELPPTPWTLPTGGSGAIKLNVNLAGKFGTVFKSAKVTTDKGQKDLMLRINIAAPVAVKLTDEQRMEGMAKAKVDRQAVFKGDCASCHSKNLAGKYGQQLFQAASGICHEAEHRATMVPDLTKLTVPTSVDFWRTWITYGKPGSLMPAFSSAQGGPLTDIQIASLAQYLNVTHPSHVTPTAP